VYISGNVGLAGNKATWDEQIGFPFADVVAKAVFGILFGAIASEKLTVEEEGLDLSVRWFGWSSAVIPLGYVGLMLIGGWKKATSKQRPPAATRLGSASRYLAVMSWCTYPFVYISENVVLAGKKATLYEQVGFSLADVVAKAVFDILFGAITSEK
jgi:hypothetical protein